MFQFCDFFFCDNGMVLQWISSCKNILKNAKGLIDLVCCCEK